jgi:hypothetical protein
MNPITDGIEMASRRKNKDNGCSGCIGTIALMAFLLTILAVYLTSVVGGCWFVIEKIFGD